MKKVKQYKLSDGKVWTAQQVADKAGLSISTARCRLCKSSDIAKVFAPRMDGHARTGSHKLYTLSDGSQWTIPDIAKRIGASKATAHARVYRSRDIKDVFAAINTSTSRDKLKLSKVIKARMCFGDRDHWLLLARVT